MTKINKLTGRPVSEESLNMLRRLENNEHISLEEIEQLPEIQEAYSCVSNSTPTNQLKNREHIVAYVIDTLSSKGSYSGVDSMGKDCYNGFVGNDRRIDIVIGLPASGKSSTIVNPLSKEFQSKVIDSDMAKELLPEFNNGWGSGIVHEESKTLIQVLLVNTIKKKQNIVYPIVGSNFKKVFSTISLAHQNGYSIYIHFADIPPMKALGRMINRFFETGRFLSPKLIYKYGNNVTNVYNSLKEVYEHERKEITRTQHDNSRNRGTLRSERPFSVAMVQSTSASIGIINNRTSPFSEQCLEGSKSTITISGYSHWNTDVPKGTPPVLLESTCTGKVFDNAIISFYKGELLSNGFKPTPSLLQKMLQLQHQTIQLLSLKEINHLYRSPESCNNQDIQNLVHDIGKKCAMQERLNLLTPEA